MKRKFAKGSVRDAVRVSMSAFAYRNCKKSQKSIQKLSRLRNEPSSTRTQVRGPPQVPNYLLFQKERAEL